MVETAGKCAPTSEKLRQPQNLPPEADGAILIHHAYLA
jgi:hypothetical protein